MHHVLINGAYLLSGLLDGVTVLIEVLLFDEVLRLVCEIEVSRIHRLHLLRVLEISIGRVVEGVEEPMT